MDPETLYHRRRFNSALEPIKVMLVNKKRKMTLVTWIDFVNQTRSSVKSKPDQYLGAGLPPEETMTRIIDDIFRDFLKAQA